MSMSAECYSCLLSQLVRLEQHEDIDEQTADGLIRSFLRRVADAPPGTNAPELTADFYEMLGVQTGFADPFREEKEASTAFALALLPKLRAAAAASDDPFAAAVKLAASGNIIDYGACRDLTLAQAEKHIRHALERELDEALLAEFRRRLNEAGSILYIADNCGELVLDRLLIEPYREKITLGVRGRPILNDATREDVGRSGLSGVPVVDTGDGTPGVSLSRSGREFLDAMENADMIVAKGQGNFETLCTYHRPIAHLLTVKCRIVGRAAGVEPGQLLLQMRNFK